MDHDDDAKFNLEISKLLCWQSSSLQLKLYLRLLELLFGSLNVVDYRYRRPLRRDVFYRRIHRYYERTKVFILFISIVCMYVCMYE